MPPDDCLGSFLFIQITTRLKKVKTFKNHIKILENPVFLLRILANALFREREVPPGSYLGPLLFAKILKNQLYH